ncbi:substrate-binding and VWA domain-containing protein [Rugosimonospora acidiphila]|uniref:Substrate-binding and VWA domain-containing protein n=1 Tax=Rugosimonospora acidiphila TaxID=556531 RepID=A0ABP9SB04_9ACTN
MPVSGSGIEVGSHHSPGWFRRAVIGRRWLVVSAVASAGVLVGAAAFIGAGGQPSAATTDDCSGDPVTLTVTTAPNLYPVLDRLARDWTATRPALNGRCLAARVTSKQPDQVAAALGPDWDATRDGARPDVWIPDSSLWLSVAGGRTEASGMVPMQPPSVASSPVVLAVREPLARALGWPGRTLDWNDVIGTFIDGWGKAGHPEWASLRIGMADATTSTAGLAAVLTILDRDGTGAIDDDQLVQALRFSQALGAIEPDTTGFFAAQAATTAKPGTAAGRDAAIAAFPALESDVAAFDEANPEQFLVPVYPSQPVVADCPYAVLSASWVGADKRSAADQFLAYLNGSTAADALGVSGLRGPDHGVRDSAALPADDGFPTTFDNVRVAPDPTTLKQFLSDWTSMQRQSNILVALDTSGSMAESVPGTSMSRLELMRQTASTGFGLLNSRTDIGLWAFSGQRAGANEYRELVPFGPSMAEVDGTSRQQAMLHALGGLRAQAHTPLYDTIYAAFKEMQTHWQADSVNAVVLITDGGNDLPSGMTLTQLLGKLKSEQRADRPVQVIDIAIGPDADADALRQISAATGGRTLVAKDPASAEQTLVLAFAGRLS